ADRRSDRLPSLWMRADLARQGQEAFRDLRCYIIERHVLRDRGALVVPLDIRTEAPRLQQDSRAELLRPIALRLVAALAELLGVTAFRIVRAGDERAELAAAQRQLPNAALRAQPRVGPVCARGVEPWREEFVERLGD